MHTPRNPRSKEGHGIPWPSCSPDQMFEEFFTAQMSGFFRQTWKRIMSSFT